MAAGSGWLTAATWWEAQAPILQGCPSHGSHGGSNHAAKPSSGTGLALSLASIEEQTLTSLSEYLGNLPFFLVSLSRRHTSQGEWREEAFSRRGGGVSSALFRPGLRVNLTKPPLTSAGRLTVGLSEQEKTRQRGEIVCIAVLQSR